MRLRFLCFVLLVCSTAMAFGDAQENQPSPAPALKAGSGDILKFCYAEIPDSELESYRKKLVAARSVSELDALVFAYLKRSFLESGIIVVSIYDDVVKNLANDPEEKSVVLAKFDKIVFDEPDDFELFRYYYEARGDSDEDDSFNDRYAPLTDAEYAGRAAGASGKELENLARSKFVRDARKEGIQAKDVLFDEFFDQAPFGKKTLKRYVNRFLEEVKNYNVASEEAEKKDADSVAMIIWIVVGSIGFALALLLLFFTSSTIGKARDEAWNENEARRNAALEEELSSPTTEKNADNTENDDE